MKAALHNGMKLVMGDGGDKRVGRRKHFHGLHNGLDVALIIGVLHC